MRDIQEQRRNERYNTRVKVYFRFPYDIDTQMKFQRVEEQSQKTLSKKYFAVSKNISAEGLAFFSEMKLQKGDFLFMELFLPGDQNPVKMQGEVRWSREGAEHDDKTFKYETGVILRTVDEVSVPESIYFDKAYQVEWSAALESVLGRFSLLSRGKL